MSMPCYKPLSMIQLSCSPMKQLKDNKQYRDNRILAGMLMVSLCGYMVACLLTGGLYLSYYLALGILSGELDLTAAQSLEGTIAGTKAGLLLVKLVTVTLFATWTYQMMKNTELISREEPLMKPGWAVGWYLIPVANFWKPLQAVKQMNRAVTEAGARSMKLNVWWGLWVFVLVMNIVFILTPRVSVADYRNVALLGLIIFVFELATAVFTFSLVRGLASKQYDAAFKMGICSN